MARIYRPTVTVSLTPKSPKGDLALAKVYLLKSQIAGSPSGVRGKKKLFGLKPIKLVSVIRDLKVAAMKNKLATRTIFLLMLFLFSLSCLSLYAQRLDRFAMSKFAADGQRGVAYPTQKTFFGKLPSDSIHSYTRQDTTFYYIWLWLPKPVKELGLQLISPVPEYASANRGDYEAEDYHDSLKAHGKYFDPVMIVERILYINSPEEIFMTGKRSDFKSVGSNDNSLEAPVQPSLKKNNSLLRVGANEKDTAYVPAGVYLILFKSADNKKPEGTFVLQVGVTEIVPGLKLFRRQDELSESY